MKKYQVLSAIFLIVFFVFVSACKTKNADNDTKIVVDEIIINAVIYTVNQQFDIAEAMAVDKGKIVFVGSNKDAERMFSAKWVTDLKGAAVYPGFADGHCHFLGYARTLFNIDLTGTTSIDEILAKTKDYFGQAPSGWLQGRGWDQNDWAESGWDISLFPNKELLDNLYPNNPVALRRVDGHALWVNSKALELAGITSKTSVIGGQVELNLLGEPSGILIDNAMDLVLNIIPENVKERDEEAVQKAQKNCLAVGLTFMHDAGLPLADVLFLQDQFAQQKLQVKIYQMISNEPDALDYFEKNGSVESDRFWVKSIKCYMDGALGSRGAWLKSSYHDSNGSSGLQLTKNEDMETVISRALNMHFQVNTHAIGNMAVAQTLALYAKQLPKENDLRWRVEHSQVVDSADLEIYTNYNIIPSVQPTHATSDMYWAHERLGSKIEEAYTYSDLLKTNNWLINGSDFPVEDINPLFGFYAAVARKDQKGFPEKGFQIENAISRVEALKAMTIWAAKGAFLENELGSLEAGKWADFVVLDVDIMNIALENVFKAKVLKTYINGEMVYQKI